MRQLLSSLPPRIVSRKWTCQLSSGQTLPSAAAMPPSAMTVCALPSSDLQISAVLAPWAEASMAARRPGAAGADHDDVVFVRLVLILNGHQNRTSGRRSRRDGDQADVQVGQVRRRTG